MPTLNARPSDRVLISEEAQLFSCFLQGNRFSPVNAHYIFVVVLIKHQRSFEFNVSQRNLRTVLIHYELVKTHCGTDNFANANISCSGNTHLNPVAGLERLESIHIPFTATSADEAVFSSI